MYWIAFAGSIRWRIYLLSTVTQEIPDGILSGPELVQSLRAFASPVLDVRNSRPGSFLAYRKTSSPDSPLIRTILQGVSVGPRA
jgi:hypothetical protein